jgi:hypothetical protein
MPTAKIGSILTANVATWANELTVNQYPIARKWQWMRNEVEIPGAEGAVYTLLTADKGQRISVKETGTQVLGPPPVEGTQATQGSEEILVDNVGSLDPKLVYTENLNYLGTFRLPTAVGGYPGEGLTFNPSGSNNQKTLLLRGTQYIGQNNDGRRAVEVSIPATLGNFNQVVDSTSFNAIPSASVVTALADPIENIIRTGIGSPIDASGVVGQLNEIGGYQTIFGADTSKALVTYYSRYQNGSSLGVFWRRPYNVSTTGQLEGPVYVADPVYQTNPRWTAGWMCAIPSTTVNGVNYQTALGGNILAGTNGLSIIGNASDGPAAISIDTTTSLDAAIAKIHTGVIPANATQTTITLASNASSVNDFYKDHFILVNVVDTTQNGKYPARVLATTNINITSSPGVIDGVGLSDGDRVVLTGQTNGAENGIYRFSASASPLTRADDAATFADLNSAVIDVRDNESPTPVGSNYGKWRQTNASLSSFSGQTWVKNGGSTIPIKITAYNGTTKVATVASGSWNLTLPLAGSTYRTVPLLAGTQLVGYRLGETPASQSGQTHYRAQGGTNNTIIFGRGSNTNNYYNNHYVYCPTASATPKKIISYTVATDSNGNVTTRTATIEGTWEIANPTSTSVYKTIPPYVNTTTAYTPGASHGLSSGHHGVSFFPIWGTTAKARGMCIPNGTRSLLFFGSSGDGYGNYGSNNQTYSGQAIYDPANNAQSYHAYPYTGKIWAYDLADLAAVKAGTKGFNDVRPYAVMPFKLPKSSTLTGLTPLGVTYDPSTRRIYMAVVMADAPTGYGYGLSVVHVYEVTNAVVA